MDKLRVSTFGRMAAHQAAGEQGIYDAEGLEVSLQITRGSKEQMRELLDGDLDIVHTNADNVFWWNEDNGANLVIVLAGPGMPNQNLVVRPEIGGYEDLRGKPVAVDAAESGFATPLRMLLREAGIEVGRDVEFVEVGATELRVEALSDRRAFGAMIGAERDVSSKGFRVLDTINRLFKDYAAGVAAVRRDWAEANTELLVRYLRAHLRGGVAAENEKSAPPVFLWAGLAEMLKMRQAAGLLRAAPDPHRFADEQYYQQAIAGWKA